MLLHKNFKEKYKFLKLFSLITIFLLVSIWQFNVSLKHYTINLHAMLISESDIYIPPSIKHIFSLQ